MLTSSVRTFGGKPLPEWFIEAFRQSDVSRYFLGILATRSTSLYTQLEDIESRSPNEYAARIRAIMWGILIKYDDKINPVVMEFYRETKEVKETTAMPIFQVKGYGLVPDLAELPHLPLENRLDLLLKSLEFNDECLIGYPDNTHMFILTTKYWINKCTPDVSFVQTILLCFVKLGIVSKMAVPSLDDSFQQLSINCGTNEASVAESGRLQYSSIESWQWKKAFKKLQPNLNIPLIKNSPQRIRVHHVFAQWLTIYSEVYRFNKLLRYPVMELGPEHCFRGTFVFSYHHYLHGKTETAADDIVRDMVGPQIFNKIYVPLQDAIY